MHFCQLVQTRVFFVELVSFLLMRFRLISETFFCRFSSLLEQVKKDAAFVNETHFLQNSLEWLALLAEINFDQLEVQRRENVH